MAGTQPQTTGSPIADSGSASFEATKTAAMALAAHIGQMAAYQRLNSGGLPPGQTITPNAVAPPNATPMPAAIPQGGMSDTHSQYGSPGMANSAAKTDLTNQIVDMANRFKAQKQQQDTLKASKDYELLMNSINFNKTLNPNDPKQAAMIEHNNQIINDFFNDPKRAGRLEKVMGFDAYDMKAEAKKQKDPDYQAFQMALKNSGTTTSTPSTVPGMPDLNLGPSATPPTPAGMKPGDAASIQHGVQDASSVNTWAQGLNPAAQKFVSNMPVGRGPMTYIPSPDEHAEMFRVANKIAPDADARSTLYGVLARWESSDLGHLMTGMKDADISAIQQKFKDTENVRDNTTRWNIALLGNAVDNAKLALEKDKLAFEQNKAGDDKSWQILNDMQAHQNTVIEGINKQTAEYENIMKDKNANGDQKRFAMTKLNELHRQQAQETEKYHSIQQDFQKHAKDKYGIQFSEPTGTPAANAVENFDAGGNTITNVPAGSDSTMANSGGTRFNYSHSGPAYSQPTIPVISPGPK